MRVILILVVICFISCENITKKKGCIIDFKIPKSMVSSEGIVTDLKFHKNILKISISNLRNDSIHFVVPHLIFAKEAIQNEVEESDIVVKQFMPNIITDRVIAYNITEDNKKKIITVDSSKTRDAEQYEFKLAPKEKFITEYLFNCKESDPEKFKIFYFESNRFKNSKYEKIKYPENAYIEIKK